MKTISILKSASLKLRTVRVYWVKYWFIQIGILFNSTFYNVDEIDSTVIRPTYAANHYSIQIFDLNTSF